MLNEKFNLIFTFHRPNDALSISDIIEKTWSKSLIAAKESRGKGIGRINTNGRWRSVAPVPCVQRKRPAPESIVKSGAGGGGSASSNDSVHSSWWLLGRGRPTRRGWRADAGMSAGGGDCSLTRAGGWHPGSTNQRPENGGRWPNPFHRNQLWTTPPRRATLSAGYWIKLIIWFWGDPPVGRLGLS